LISAGLIRHDDVDRNGDPAAAVNDNRDAGAMLGQFDKDAILVEPAKSAFGEMLAACMVLAAVLAGLSRRPIPIAILGFLAALGKETMPPFLLILILIAAHDGVRGWRPERRILVAASAGIGCAVAVMGTASSNGRCTVPV